MLLPEIVDPGSGSGGPTFPLAALMAAALFRRKPPRLTGDRAGGVHRDMGEWRLIARLNGEGAFPQCWWVGSASVDVARDRAGPDLSIVIDEWPEIFFEPRNERLFAHQVAMLDRLENLDSCPFTGYALVELGEPPQRGGVEAGAGDECGAALQRVRESLVQSPLWEGKGIEPNVVELSRAEIDAAARASGAAPFRVAA